MRYGNAPVSPDGMQTPLSPGDKIFRPVWVGGLLKLLKKPAYDDSFVMVRALPQHGMSLLIPWRGHMHGSQSVPHHNKNMNETTVTGV